ncbi:MULTISPECIES: chorismate--pyruvate lyase family protein [unclassified Agarivorans]|uniref:chorismate--pyruvate lyase family protein n=1 Tax=unclassified Agarivorans TaxID=2636026 RepID=UPI003D7CCA25
MNSKQPYPYQADGRWQQPQNVELESTALADWLLYPGSLTARLRQHCQHFSIQVLFEGYLEITEAERQALDCEGPYWVREVLLCCDDLPWVYARSVVPQDSLAGEAAAVSYLQNNSLGELLFTDKGQRQTLELCQVDAHSALQQSVGPKQPLWGRRSRFLLAGAPLLVAEFFLPASLAYQGVDRA